jgi:hypothetical protein
MSETVVTFVGICTHIRRILLTPPENALSPSDRSPAYYSRAISVNASYGARLGTQGIPPHDSVLYIPKEFLDDVQDPVSIPGLRLIDADAVAWKMEGVHLYVANAQGELTSRPSYELVPSLTDRAEVLSLQLDPRVVRDGCASAVLDIYAGEIDAYRNPKADDAVHVKLRIPTMGPSPELIVTRVWDQQSTAIRLKDGVVEGVEGPPNIFLMNTGRDSDKEIDFLLHYYVTTWTPPREGLLPTPGDLSGIRSATPDEQRLLRHIPDGLSIGCSNSVYP